MEEIDSNNLFSYFEEGGQADAYAASVEEYEDFFGTALLDAESVIHLSVSSKMALAYDIAHNAADSFDNVRVVYSCHIGSGLGIMALYAVELAEMGKSVEEIIEDLDAYAKSIVATLLVPSLDSPIIQKAFSAPVRGLFRAFSWEPVLRVRNGSLHLSALHGGYVADAPEKYIRSALRHAKRKADKSMLYVTYSGCTLQEQEEILELVNTYSDFDQVIMEKSSATVAARVWLHSFGITYVEN